MKTEGTVQSVSPEGDLITTITADQLSGYQRDAQLRVVVDEEHETFGIFDSPEGQPAMTLLAIQSGDDSLRVHLVGDSAAMMLGIRAGAKVVVQS
jgi:S-adenosylmethionine hydrolase